MACADLDSAQLFSHHLSFDISYNLKVKDCISTDNLAIPDASASRQLQAKIFPKAPPQLKSSCSRYTTKRRPAGYVLVPRETRRIWNSIFDEGHGADVHIITDDNSLLAAHSCVLSTASPVLRTLLEQAQFCKGLRCIKIRGVPIEAVHTFLRFLYSSCYQPDDLNRNVLHLLVMSHMYSIPSLKNVCIELLEQALLTVENVADLLQLAKECDAPRLSMICTRMIINDFKNVSVSEGWKVMKKANPRLEQELLGFLVERDTKRQERLKRIEEKKVYMQIYQAMQALLHICRDGCKTIGPRDQTLKDTQLVCNFPACKGVETLFRHFSTCKARSLGRCAHCKRLWQLLELHSRMCLEQNSCKVPLCRHFKEKFKLQSKKEEQKWKMLVRKVMEAKGTISSISAWRSVVA
ncbi:hypothetical protein HPP92_011406 [Vanilla planifolia]|uniref:BTB/POZ and TAZ domain-containing protein 3 n=1 Tax=Vanilla planifolia TaxID=51239 RepID=A0A835V2S8_VANPL|nr:hypothetical protein HPP92_011406 [Vanilla planifolia]